MARFSRKVKGVIMSSNPSKNIKKKKKARENALSLHPVRRQQSWVSSDHKRVFWNQKPSPKITTMDRRRWDRQDGRRTKKQKLIRSAEEELEAKLGYDLFSEGDKRLGWLLTFASVTQFLIFLNILDLIFIFKFFFVNIWYNV